MKANKFYDKRFLYKSLGYIFVFVVLMKLSSGAGFALAIPFAFAAAIRRKPESLMFWILLASVTVLGNYNFMPKGSIYAISNRLLLCGLGVYGGLLFLSETKSKYVTPLLGIFGYLIYAFIPSMGGWAPMVSYLKITMFSLIYMTLIYSANNTIQSKRVDFTKVRSVFLAFAIFILFGSVALLPFPGWASLDAEAIKRGGDSITSLFTGVLNHSQALGPVACALGVFLLGDLMFSIQKPDKLYIALFLSCPVLLYKTSSRTAMGSFLVGCMFLSFFFMQARGIKQTWKSKVVSIALAVGIVGSISVLAIPAMRNQVIKFANKSYSHKAGDQGFNMEQALATRSFLVERQIENIKKKLAIGWGFQVSEEIGLKAAHSTGLILTAPIEKGVWITALLEEGGVIGFIIYVTYFIVAMCILLVRKVYIGAALLFMFHISCLGEFSMFSMSSEGGIWYTLIFMSIVFDAQRLKKKRLVPIYMPFYPPPPPMYRHRRF